MRRQIQGVARNLVAVLLGATIVLVSCSQPTSMPRAAKIVAPPHKNRVPPPDPNKYVIVRDASDWQNPYLLVQANGIHVRPISTATEAPTMSPGDVVAYLEKLPPIAWPYGLVVAVQENGLRNPGDDVPLKRNREELVRLLEKAGIKVGLWPSA
jgi:hypothetical protein